MPSPYTPSPPPAPSAASRRRRRRLRQHLLLSPFSAAARTSCSPSAASSSPSSPAFSSTGGGLSMFSFSRSPSPFHHRLLSPLRPAAAASAVPFAWEHRPGVPRTPVRQLRSSTSSRAAKGTAPLPLPLPPSRVVLSGTGRKVGAEDYSFTALTDVEGGAKERLGRRVRRQTALAAATLTDCLAVLSLCRQSCTMSRDCLVGTPPPQRPREMPGKGAVVGCSGY